MEQSKTRKLISDWPQNISYDNSDLTISSFYAEQSGAVKNPNSIFFNKRLLDIFLFSMAIGKNLKMRIPLRKRSRSMPTDALKPEEIWLMTAVALAEPGNDIDILTRPGEIVEICEQYANAGIPILVKLDRESISPDPLSSYQEYFKEIVSSLEKGSDVNDRISS